MIWAIYRLHEKAWKCTGKLELNFPYMAIIKALKMSFASISGYDKNKLQNLQAQFMLFIDQQKYLRK